MSSKLSYNRKRVERTLALSLVLIVVMALGQLYVKKQRYEIPVPSTQPSTSEIPYAREGQKNAIIFVHITGEVMNPSVIEIEKGSRLFEAVEKAGGFTQDADRERINLAQELVDGSQYIIPRQGEDLVIIKNDGSRAQGVVSENDGKVNINRASKEELKTLNGIGEVLAERIIATRERLGGFSNVSQLLEVEGIGESKFNSIKDQVFCS